MNRDIFLLTEYKKTLENWLWQLDNVRLKKGTVTNNLLYYLRHAKEEVGYILEDLLKGKEK